MPVVQAILVPPPPDPEEGKDEQAPEAEGRPSDASFPFATKSQISHMSQVVPIPEETNDGHTESAERSQ